MSRSKKPTELKLLMNDELLGTVAREGARLSFIYDAAALSSVTATALSLSMPLTSQRHSDPVVSNFLWGLLPDNELIIESWAKREHVSPKSAFQMIGAFGEDLPGAIQAGYPDEIESFASRIGIRRLSREKLATHVAAMMRAPGNTQLTEHGGRFSLAGAQTKKALCWINGAFYDPQGRTPSTHILKPPIPQLDGQVENEHFCLTLARQLGLRAARSNVVSLGDTPVIVVERYDRLRVDGARRLPLTSSGGKVLRVHQEDLCQAHGVHPSLKYQNEGGPGIDAIMSVLSGSTVPLEDRTEFMRAIALNFVVAGTDAHAKNYSILHLPGGAYRLAPLYDVISALPYEGRHKDRKLAMSIGGEYRYDRVLPFHWEQQARSCKYDPDSAVAHVRDFIARVPEASAEVLRKSRSEGLDTGNLPKLVDLIAQRCAALASRYGKEIASVAEGPIASDQ